MKANLLDKAISYVNPNAGLSRTKARLVHETITNHTNKRRYEGSSKGRRTKNWFTPSTSANTETETGLVKLRDRSRDLVRNNPYSKKAIKVIGSNVIGTGIIPQSKNKNLEKLWKQWGETTECDADGKHTFYGLQNLAIRSIARDGEVLIRRRRRRFEDKLAVPIQLQVLEGDFLDHGKTITLIDGNKIIQGVEFNAIGKRVAYWLFPEHPGGTTSLTTLSFQSRRVSAENILHIYDVDRAGQVRGVPWSDAVIIRSRDFDEYEDAQLLKQKVSACLALFYNTPEVDNVNSTTTKVSEKLEPGMIEELPPGYEVNVVTPPSVDGYDIYSRQVLGAIACGYGITYESLTGDLSNTNYSSGRIGFLEMNRNIQQWRKIMMIPQMCTPAWNWFVEAATLSNGNMNEVKKPSWTAPRREMIDPSKETEANIKKIRSGQATLQEVIREGGQDPIEVINEIAATNQLLDAKEIILDSDPRKVNRSGSAQGAVNSDDPNNSDDDKDDKDGARYFEAVDGSFWRFVEGKLEKITS